MARVNLLSQRSFISNGASLGKYSFLTGSQFAGNRSKCSWTSTGGSPKIRFGLSRSKLYIIFAMFGDGLRPTSQTKQRTHIIGIAAGKDRDFAENWISEFEQEYSARPALRTVGVNN